MRGETHTHQRDGIYRAARRGESTYLRDRMDAVAGKLMTSTLRVEPGKANLLATRRDVNRGWHAVSHLLVSTGVSSACSFSADST